MFGEEEDEVSLQISLYVGALAPVSVFSLVIDDHFHLLGEGDQLVLLVVEIVFVGESLKDVVKSLLLEIDTHLAEGFLLPLQGVEEIDDLPRKVIEDVADESGLFVAFVVFVHESL